MLTVIILEIPAKPGPKNTSSARLESGLMLTNSDFVENTDRGVTDTPNSIWMGMGHRNKYIRRSRDGWGITWLPTHGSSSRLKNGLPAPTVMDLCCSTSRRADTIKDCDDKDFLQEISNHIYKEEIESTIAELDGKNKCFLFVNCKDFKTILSNVTFPDATNIKNGVMLLQCVDESRAHAKTKFHDETLMEHLMQSAEASHKFAMSQGWVKKESPWLYFVAGFLHDIGKLGTERMSSMKGHATVGAGTIDSWILSEDFKTKFSLSEEDAHRIVHTTNLHMAMQIDESLDFVNMVMGENTIAKQMLCAVNYGDGMGKKPQTDVNYKKVMRKLMLSTADDDEAMETGDHQSSHLLMDPHCMGILINVTGKSGSGKSTFSTKLVKYLNDQQVDNVVLIQRDECVRRVVTEFLHAGKRPSKNLTKKEIYKIFKDNHAKLKGPVSSMISGIVGTSLAFNSVVILDTMAIMDPQHRGNLLNAHVMPGTCVLDLWMHRGESTYTNEQSLEHIGKTKKDHIDFNAEHNGYSTDWNVFGEKINWRELSSIIETRRVENNGKGGGDDFKKRPVMTLPVNVERVHGKSCVFEILKNLLEARRRAMEAVQCVTNSTTAIDWSLKDLLSYLVAQDPSMKYMKKFFKALQFSITINEQNGLYGVCIKYIDPINHLIQPNWAREARGKGFIINTSTTPASVVVVKDCLQRTVEILTYKHIDNDVKASQDMMHVNDLSNFPDSFCQVINKFKNEENAQESFSLIEKVDGCLLVISCLHTSSQAFEVMKRFLEDVDENTWWRVEHGDWLIIPSQSGSMTLQENMKSTFLTSISDLTDSFDKTVTDDEVWRSVKNTFAQRVEAAVLSQGETYHLQCEAVCKQRTTRLGYTHNELAIKYDFSAIYLLGNCCNGSFVPVKDMHIQDDTFFKKPQNLQLDNTSDALKKLEQKKLSHPEGFMVFTEEHGLFKLKTVNYYVAHSAGRELHKIFSKGEIELPLSKEILNHKVRDLIEERNDDIFPELKRISVLLSEEYKNKYERFFKNCEEIVIKVKQGDIPNIHKNITLVVEKIVKSSSTLDDEQQKLVSFIVPRMNDIPGFARTVRDMFVQYFHDDEQGCKTDESINEEAKEILNCYRRFLSKGSVSITLYLYKMTV